MKPPADLHLAGMARVHVLPLTALLALLGACTSIQYTDVPTDTRMPELQQGATTVQPCNWPTRGKPFAMPHEGCLVPVQARDFLSFTPISVAPGQAYELVIPPGQYWFDADRRSSPPKGDPGSDAMNFFKAWKRHPDLPWFSLMAVAMPCQTPQEIGQICHGAPSGPVFHLSAATNRYEPTSGGQLAFYANDAELPVFKQRMYRNNSGRVWVWVRRLDRPGG